MERPGPLVVWDSSSSAYWEGWRKAAARKATPEQRSDWSVYVRQLRLRQEYEERLWDLTVQEEIEEEEAQRLAAEFWQRHVVRQEFWRRQVFVRLTGWQQASGELAHVSCC